MPATVPVHRPSSPVAVDTGRARGPVVVPLAAGAALLVLVAGLVAGSTRTADAEEASVSSCAGLVARYTPQLPTGWTAECAASLPAAWVQAPAAASAAPAPPAGVAMSRRSERRIVVVDGRPAEETEPALAHEVAHAEASAWPADLRAAAAKAMGEARWAGGPASPMEVFAESSVRCRGLPTRPEHPLVPCSFVEAARSAGGATAPLPVTGTHPTS